MPSWTLRRLKTHTQKGVLLWTNSAHNLQQLKCIRIKVKQIWLVFPKNEGQIDFLYLSQSTGFHEHQQSEHLHCISSCRIAWQEDRTADFGEFMLGGVFNYCFLPFKFCVLSWRMISPQLIVELFTLVKIFRHGSLWQTLFNTLGTASE